MINWSWVINLIGFVGENGTWSHEGNVVQGQVISMTSTVIGRYVKPWPTMGRGAVEAAVGL